MIVAAFPEPSAVADPVREPLLLVADELAVTLNEARAALEQYAEGEVGNQPLERCAALLHTARGVLQITETWGASLLAEEMEQTCRHMAKTRRDAQTDDGIEAFLHGFSALTFPRSHGRISTSTRFRSASGSACTFAPPKSALPARASRNSCARRIRSSVSS